MSEGPEVPEESLSRSTSTSQTAGALLRAAREREGLHVAALAVSIKVPVKKLEALEADRLDLLPDAVFVRALAGSVCRALKIDPVSVLDLLPSSGPPKLRPDGRGINTPFDSPRAGGGHNLKNAIARPPTVIVIVLLLAALGVFLFPDASTELAGFEQKSEQEGVRPTASESITAPGSAAPEAIATK
ncbi:MAG: helix-turn-helix domain-containing protein, partial [Bradyrhizobium sp. PARBB1]